VDSLLKRQEVVVKGLDEGLTPGRMVFGLSILGDGRVAPILDCAHILAEGAGMRGPSSPSTRPGQGPALPG
jgi:chemotaxis protein histidine kinase CheA